MTDKQVGQECWDCGESLAQCMARPRFKCCARCKHPLEGADLRTQLESHLALDPSERPEMVVDAASYDGAPTPPPACGGCGRCRDCGFSAVLRAGPDDEGPARLVGALHDRVHEEIGVGRPARAHRTEAAPAAQPWSWTRERESCLRHWEGTPSRDLQAACRLLRAAVARIGELERRADDCLRRAVDQIEKLEADAQRYRKLRATLRGSGLLISQTSDGQTQISTYRAVTSGPNLDAAVDALPEGETK